jgi:hypothetical protein
MLNDDARAKVARQVKQFTETYERSKKEHGFNMQATALPTFDSQEDFDRCRPEEKGVVDFKQHNEFVEEVAKGLAANGIVGKPVVFHYDAFSKWLNGQPITPQLRAAYGAYLLAEASQMN